MRSRIRTCIDHDCGRPLSPSWRELCLDRDIPGTHCLLARRPKTDAVLVISANERNLYEPMQPDQHLIPARNLTGFTLSGTIWAAC